MLLDEKVSWGVLLSFSSNFFVILNSSFFFLFLLHCFLMDPLSLLHLFPRSFYKALTSSVTHIQPFLCSCCYQLSPRPWFSILTLSVGLFLFQWKFCIFKHICLPFSSFPCCIPTDKQWQWERHCQPYLIGIYVSMYK